jgi:hypothetical protein
LVAEFLASQRRAYSRPAVGTICPLTVHFGNSLVPYLFFPDQSGRRYSGASIQHRRFEWNFTVASLRPVKATRNYTSIIPAFFLVFSRIASQELNYVGIFR